MVRGVVLILGVVAHALDLMVPEAIRKKVGAYDCRRHWKLSHGRSALPEPPWMTAALTKTTSSVNHAKKQS